ncbi:DUF262 domain-containing protein [bacterium]|nr:DUF262 domain-containing protein [bacterium]
MKITLNPISIKELYSGYENDGEDGVVALNGNLNIRPKFQREFIYNEKEQKAVIDSIMKNFPLNTMYWVDNNNGTYEVLDGQQRTLSICEFLEGNFPITINGKEMYIHNIRRIMPNVYEQILDYKLFVYHCNGTKEEQLDWFTTINIAGKQLSEQELRNINYVGDWLTDAKRYFSKTGGAAYQIGAKYVKGEFNRQEVLEKVIKWFTNADIPKEKNEKICEYMAKNQFNKDAKELWNYFVKVIDWVKELFPNYRKEMKGIEWGFFYNKYKDKTFNPDELEEEIVRLLMDDDVKTVQGIYKYLFEKNEKFLNLRSFDRSDALSVYHLQKGICPICGQAFSFDEMEADHKIPWSKGGKTNKENCQMLCRHCNRTKSAF